MWCHGLAFGRRVNFGEFVVGMVENVCSSAVYREEKAALDISSSHGTEQSCRAWDPGNANGSNRKSRSREQGIYIRFNQSCRVSKGFWGLSVVKVKSPNYLRFKLSAGRCRPNSLLCSPHRYTLIVDLELHDTL